MTQNKQHKKHLWWKWIFVVLVLLIAIIGIPVGINECYKANTGYLTVWNGADVLAFYGTILGAVIGAAIAVLTIKYIDSIDVLNGGKKIGTLKLRSADVHKSKKQNKKTLTKDQSIFETSALSYHCYSFEPE